MKNKVCSRCHKEKPIIDFYKCSLKKSNWCKKCYIEAGKIWVNRDRKSNREKYRARNRAWFRKHRYQAKMYRLKQTYGVPHDLWEELFTKQNKKCAICGLEKTLSLDHDHTTEKVRGLLCNNCNLGIGLMKDKISIVRSALKYLEGHDEK